MTDLKTREALTAVRRYVESEIRGWQPLPAPPERSDFEQILRRLVMEWDADHDLEFDEQLELARAALGLVLAPRCVQHDLPHCTECLVGSRSVKGTRND